MDIELFGRNGAGRLAAPGGHDRFFRGSVRAARALSVPTSGLDLTSEVELPTDRPIIFAANHSSLFDLVASLIALDHYGLTTRIGVNARFFTNPVVGQFLRRLGCIAFSRERGSEAEDEMVAALEAGHTCALMPEGRIVRPADRIDGVGPGRTGVSRIARRAGAAVIPVGFTGADRVWPPGSARIRVGLRRPPIVTRFGPPIWFTTNDHNANVAHLMSVIAALLAHEGGADRRDG